MSGRKPMTEIVLASASERRACLLREAGYSFRIIPPRGEGRPEPLLPPEEIAEKLALSKAKEVARSIERGLVLSADTLIVHDGTVIGKPKDRSDAERILECLSGTVHRVITAVSLIAPRKGRWLVAWDASLVAMARLAREELEEYLNSALWRGKAGAYGIQDNTKIPRLVEGSYSNVVGLPMELLERMLKAFPARETS
jgi:septum formation protein